ncbi:TPA: fimbrial biogenesis chaperone [Photobacterium damselae]
MKVLLSFILLILTINTCYASVVINGTRFIYNEKDNNISLVLNNTKDTPVVVQAWLDDGIHLNKNWNTPFLLDPAVFRIDGKHSQVIKIHKINHISSKNQEKIYYINILEIPPKNKGTNKNIIKVAIKSRLKLLYRPKDITGNIIDSANNIKYKVENGKVIFINKSDFNIQLTSIFINGNEFKVGILLKSHDNFIWDDVLINYKDKIEIKWINDFGAKMKNIIKKVN